MRRGKLKNVWLLLAVCGFPAAASAQETLWLEAEHLDGLVGYCWPMGRPEMKVTNGNWGLSGPGWAAEWNQGGESNFLSVACAADDDRAVMTKQIEIPAAGDYAIWVRYRDVREASERFTIQIEQPGAAAWQATYGERPVVEEDNEMKLYWGWAFGWDRRQAPLAKGPAKLSLLSAYKEPDCRQIDIIVLTTDADYRPLIKERPRNIAWKLLAEYGNGALDRLEPLARRIPDFSVPDAWQPRTFRDAGFRYLWNMDNEVKWAGDDPNRVPVPYQLRDPDVLAAFEAKYAGRSDVPIFSDPRIVPTFHAVGPKILQTDSPDPALKAASERFVRWLDAHPDRFWATMMNYHPDDPLTPGAIENFSKYRDRYIGSIAGESLGYFYPPEAEMRSATAAANTRRQLVEAFAPLDLATNAAKYRAVFGRDLEQPYLDVIPCPSIGGIQFYPIGYQWGARTMGYESSAATSALLSMRWAFLRGAARQNAGLTATYRSCNFGDSSTIFSDTQSYSKAANILDNYYSVYSGAGMTWYKMDIWYQYMAGASMFFHEQGFDEFWMPGGTTAAGRKEVQLSPKGLLVDRFLRLTAAEPDRGTPFTPVAILADYAHGWEPSSFYPGEFLHHAGIPREKTRPGDHEQMLHEYFWTAYHPIGPKSEEPITSTNEVYVPGVFGDIFDIVYAYPDVNRWTTIDTYPVVIAAGDIELTAAEGERLASYVENGGTLCVADGHLTGPGAAALELPATGEPVEAAAYRWLDDATIHPAQVFRFRPISSGRPLATSPNGQTICAGVDRGQGRIVYLSVPRGMGIDRQAVPLVPRLFAHLTRGLMPIEVEGDVEWMLNKSATGWLVTLLNPAGQSKPQQGITPTDFRQNRAVTIQSTLPLATAHDRLLPGDPLTVEQTDGRSWIELEVPAGGVRIIDLR